MIIHYAGVNGNALCILVGYKYANVTKELQRVNCPNCVSCMDKADQKQWAKSQREAQEAKIDAERS